MLTQNSAQIKSQILVVKKLDVGIWIWQTKKKKKHVKKYDISQDQIWLFKATQN